MTAFFEPATFGAVFVTLFAIIGQQVLRFLGFGIRINGLLLSAIAVQLIPESVMGFVAEAG